MVQNTWIENQCIVIDSKGSNCKIWTENDPNNYPTLWWKFGDNENIDISPRDNHGNKIFVTINQVTLTIDFSDVLTLQFIDNQNDKHTSTNSYNTQNADLRDSWTLFN